MKPGLNLLYPWETILASPRTQEITWPTPPVRLTTAHNQDVELAAAVTYQLDPRDAHFAVKEVADWEADLHQHFVGVLKSVAYELAPDDFIGWSQHIHNRAQAVDNLSNSLVETRWDRLNKALKRRLEDQVAKNGITIHMVQVLDMTVISRSTPVDMGIVRSLAAQPSQSPQPLSAQQAAIAAQPTAQPGQVVLPAPDPAATPAKPFVLSPGKIQGMKDAFDSIRDGRLTDLGTIVKLRRDFEQIAANPDLDAQFPYDAKQAISSLNKRIDAIQAEAKSGQVAASAVPVPVAAAQPARPARRLPRLPNDNLAGGG